VFCKKAIPITALRHSFRSISADERISLRLFFAQNKTPL
jgi:hypothetical protein